MRLLSTKMLQILSSKPKKRKKKQRSKKRKSRRKRCSSASRKSLRNSPKNETSFANLLQNMKKSKYKGGFFRRVLSERKNFQPVSSGKNLTIKQEIKQLFDLKKENQIRKTIESQKLKSKKPRKRQKLNTEILIKINEIFKSILGLKKNFQIEAAVYYLKLIENEPLSQIYVRVFL